MRFLFYAIPVRSAQSVWFRIKFLLLIAAAVNAFLFHRRMLAAGDSWSGDARAPVSLRRGAALSLSFWVMIVICGRLIAYDWFDCSHEPTGLIGLFAGCIDGQMQF